MISYQWFLAPDQPFNKDALYRLQYCLYAAGVYLDLSWNEGSPVMTISVPEDLMVTVDVQTPEDDPTPTGCNTEDPPSEEAVRRRKRGRPAVIVKNDLTLGHVRHMRFMNNSVEKIAEEIGVSKRTCYRRWEQAEKMNIDENTPFSRWLEHSGQCAINH